MRTTESFISLSLTIFVNSSRACWIRSWSAQSITNINAYEFKVNLGRRKVIWGYLREFQYNNVSKVILLNPVHQHPKHSNSFFYILWFPHWIQQLELYSTFHPTSIYIKSSIYPLEIQFNPFYSRWWRHQAYRWCHNDVIRTWIKSKK